MESSSTTQYLFLTLLLNWIDSYYLAINYSFEMKEDQELHTLSAFCNEDKVHYAEARFFLEQLSRDWGPLLVNSRPAQTTFHLSESQTGLVWFP